MWGGDRIYLPLIEVVTPALLVGAVARPGLPVLALWQLEQRESSRHDGTEPSVELAIND